MPATCRDPTTSTNSWSRGISPDSAGRLPSAVSETVPTSPAGTPKQAKQPHGQADPECGDARPAGQPRPAVPPGAAAARAPDPLGGGRTRPCSAASTPRQRRAGAPAADRKSTRLNSSHLGISYAVFCLKKKKQNKTNKSTETRNHRHYKTNRQL